MVFSTANVCSPERSGSPLPQVVWLKRDLRWTDHAPWVHAAQRGPVLVLWMDEPDLWAQDDASPRHRGFALACAQELDQWVTDRGGRLWVPRLNAVDVFTMLRQRIGPFALHSHEETGNLWSYARDQAVARWCQLNGIQWTEYPTNAVVRRLHLVGGRDRWSSHWATRMGPEPLRAPPSMTWVTPKAMEGLPLLELQGLTLRPGPQVGGVTQAWRALDSFLQERGQAYRSGMSSPLSAETVCSRLSAHLAWGSLSIRECVHAVWRRRQQLLALAPRERPEGFLASLKSFESRLHWHCHFIQKLETEPSVEHRHMHRGFDNLREERPLQGSDLQRLQAWANGQTGFPFLDACMRSLQATGWINFRMRAMLMSFASQQLWLHWRHSGLHLARLFTDYEPGIHWSQCQMQSGVTGINTVRIYNPVKQGLDQDPQGVFVRRWVPELADVPQGLLHTPWLAAGAGQGYPKPVVDLAAATRLAKQRVHERKASDDVRAQSQRVYELHGSRHPQRDRSNGTRTQATRKKFAGAGASPTQAGPRGPSAQSLQMGFDFDSN